MNSENKVVAKTKCAVCGKQTTEQFSVMTSCLCGLDASMSRLNAYIDAKNGRVD